MWEIHVVSNFMLAYLNLSLCNCTIHQVWEYPWTGQQFEVTEVMDSAFRCIGMYSLVKSYECEQQLKVVLTSTQ